MNIDFLSAKLDIFISFMNSGGLAMWILFVLNLLLWFGLGQRRLILRRGTNHNIRRLVEKHVREEGRKPRGILDQAIIDGLEAAAEAHQIGAKTRIFIDEALFPYFSAIKKHSILIKTIVVIAPLIGLLGTVSGMIETFDALQTSAMFSQGASISGGISKALFTTELGLVVAVPGLIIGRVLDRKEYRFAMEFDQLTNIICTKENKA
ncbi:MAG: MotA/TolQ/ExbB proton channel family protein [Proteobacteria bacterium]|nr:MotA/TolQ/ExbB proton channel family protein [Pseudomonadota bacterium]MBU1714267.1 MotA/TolQ/ExbB proton channel family protein [Pseudomonadota bacterium]